MLPTTANGEPLQIHRETPCKAFRLEWEGENPQMPNIRKYGIAFKTCGVYMLTNKLNGKKYIGSSACIGSRLSDHFGQSMRNPKGRPLYTEMNEYGKEAFEYCVLEECDKSIKVDREQYWVEKLNPEYNLTYPKTREFISTERKNKVKHSTKQQALYARNKELYQTKEYRDRFREQTRKRMKPVILLNKETNEEIMRFESLQSTANWLDKNTTSKNPCKVSEVKKVCDGQQITALGFKYKYVNEEDRFIHKGTL